MGSERGYHLHPVDAGRSVQKFPSTAPVLGTWISYYRDVWNSGNDVAAWCQTTFWNTGTKKKYGSLLYKKQKGKKSTLLVGNKKTKRNMRLAVKKQAPTPLDNSELVVLFHLWLFSPLFQTSELELETFFSSFGEAVNVRIWPKNCFK